MADTLRIALARFNPLMAEPEANAAALDALRAEAAGQGAELIITPAFSLSGAVPPALARDPALAAALESALAALAARPGPAMLVGAPWRNGTLLHEAVHLLDGGAIRARRAAHEPGSGFDPGPAPGPVAWRGARLGLMAGRDWRRPATPETLAETGAELLVALDSLPHETGGAERILQAALARAVENGLPLLLLNRLGAEDEDAHDGAALVLNADRSPALRLPPFTEGLTLTEWRRDGLSWRCVPQPLHAPPGPEESLWRALILALRDHAGRHAPAGILLPLTASPDSSLLAVLAMDAFAPEAIRPVLLDEAALPAAERLGLSPLRPALAPAAAMLSQALGAPVAGEDLHRLALDSLARSGGLLPLVTGSSAIASAFAPLRHLSRAQRRALAAWRNAHRPAGLRGPERPAIPLPPEAQAGPGADPPAATLWQSLAHADYKRRHLPPGLNPAPRAFQDRTHSLGHPNPQEAPAP
ncbi:hypothetical protein J8J14_17135 [Roseomonas sp. SSH11]|uniref:CN hydrolase domain-containing protein n=1 Tax=Pararoseomonas baculiformis TaxID=2820812 RepID=A0ABS4AHJ9_9PROT|nr:nitrilase-related carbon-nitrogen hydrolase [Pararoseomonas baculiformis]MBP0446502.1 hypothetical protein [Pararoseomonas baculiformis]